LPPPAAAAYEVTSLFQPLETRAGFVIVDAAAPEKSVESIGGG